MIPGAERPRAGSWPFCSHRCLSELLPPDASRARIWTFEYTFPMGGSFTLQNIWLEGERLFKLLPESRKAESSHEVWKFPRLLARHHSIEKQVESNRRPMLLICHSLGGIKQAFCIVNEQLHRYEYLVNQVAGIIFISTPHLGSGRASILETALFMLRTTTRTSLKLSP